MQAAVQPPQAKQGQQRDRNRARAVVPPSFLSMPLLSTHTFVSHGSDCPFILPASERAMAVQTEELVLPGVAPLSLTKESANTKSACDVSDRAGRTLLGTTYTICM